MSNKIDSYAKLRSILHEMEMDIGITDRPNAEKNIISAISQLQHSASLGSFVKTRDIKTHPLCLQMPSPSFFRALKKLQNDGLLILPSNRIKGLYRLKV